jgi:superfamily I DNA/RNA helicase
MSWRDREPQVGELSESQRRLVEWDTSTEGDLFAEACPGAGKTRAIVARFARLTAEEPRKGIALLSFTNAAVDEVRSRCGDRPEALRAPNFVGTFDGFINRYLTRPLYAQHFGRTPHFLETWEGVKAARFRAGQDKVPDFDMSWFELDGQLHATLVEAWIPRKDRGALGPVIKAQRDAVERRAGFLCRSLVRRGLVSCAASRALAVGYLSEPENEKRISYLLGNRFREVIIDEAQDCGPEELLILRLLRRFNVSVTAVADMDQSIYEFRRAEQAAVHAFKDELPGSLLLSGNFRSSPAICALNNSLRTGSHTESAVGGNSACTDPVRLLDYRSLPDVARAVDGLLDFHGVGRDEVIVLAHARKDAREAAGGRREDAAQGGGAIAALAAAHTVLTAAGSSAAERSRAVRRVESILRDLADLEEQPDSVADQRWLRDTAVRLAISVVPSDDAGEYAAQVRQHVRDISWPDSLTRPSDLSLLRAPKQGKWTARGNAAVPTAYAWASIHSVKGREFPGVVVVVPQKLTPDSGELSVLDHWEQGEPSEARRVLYVGVSRAQRLLILAVHTSHRDRVAALLKRDNVHVELA